jgi:hypothetical protein
MTKNNNYMTSKILFDKTSRKFLERQMMVDTLCCCSCVTPPWQSPQRSAVLQLPCPSPQPPPLVPAAPAGRATSASTNKHKLTHPFSKELDLINLLLQHQPHIDALWAYQYLLEILNVWWFNRYGVCNCITGRYMSTV